MTPRRLLSALSAVLCASFLVEVSHGATGRTPGSFSVTPHGAATYTIPIWAPPGPRGIEPKVAITYSSHSGNGPLGVGWSINGLSRITRCNRTYAQDAGVPARVTLTYGDAFCLDGRRLRLTSGGGLGTYGQDGTTYQTEITDFAKVTAHGVAGNGPMYFTVQGKDGLTYEYGSGGNSRVFATGTSTASSWLISKVSDRSNNRMVVTYLPPSATRAGTTVPDEISWTPSSAGSTAYNYVMKFNYTGNAPESSIVGYVAGTSVLNQDLLANITISNSASATIKRYVFGYDTSPTTARYRLTELRECADIAQTNCLLPTSISYQNGQVGVSTTASTPLTGIFGFSGRHDFNADGFRDLLYASGPDSTSAFYYVAFGSASGFGSPVSTGIGFYNMGPVGDLLGRGQDGFLINNAGTKWYYTWNPVSNSFTGVSTGFAGSGDILVDTDGDGLRDLVSWGTANSGGTTLIRVLTRRNTSANGSIQFSSTAVESIVASCVNCGATVYNPVGSPGPFVAWDINGDAREDLLMELRIIINQTTTRRLVALVSNGATFSSTTMSDVTTNPSRPPFVLRWNSDSCDDVLWNSTIHISNCNGGASGTFNVPTTFLTALDWNEDGRTDLLAANGSTIGVYLSTGTGVSALQATSVPYITSCANSYFTADINADSIEDLGCWSQGAPTSVHYYLHNGVGQPADLVSSVTDGYGMVASPTYVTTSRGSYTKGTTATYPEQEVSAPLNVVSQTTHSNGTGGTYTQSFAYTGARQNIQGYGFSGFQSITMSDSRPASLVRKTTFQTSFPFAGMRLSEDILQHNGTTLVSHSSYINDKIDLDTAAGNQRSFVFVQAATTQTYEVGGPKNGQLITTTATSSTYDSYGNATNVSTTVTDNDSGSPYSGQQWTSTVVTSVLPDAGSNWCLNQPTRIAVTKTAPGISSTTRTTDYTPDYSTCRPTVRVIEPQSPNYRVTETYGFDSFGNVDSMTVAGINMPSRTSTMGWGTTGQFMLSTTNPLGQTTSFDYDFKFGLQSSITDPNGVQRTKHYDSFGRIDSETRADGTQTTWSYSDCASSVGCWIGAHGLIVSETTYNSNGTVQTDSTTYFDPLERPLISRRRSLNGGSYDRNEVRYDSFGRVAQQAMPCVWSTYGVTCAHWTETSFDALGRVVQVQRPISEANGTLQAAVVQYAGRTTTVVDPQGKQSVKIATVAGMMGRSQDHNGYFQNFVYDGFNSLLAVSDSLGNTLFTASYDYGLQALPRDVVDMDLDVSASAGQHRRYDYNALGELVGWSDAKGQSFSQTYDALSRPLVRTEPGLTTSWIWGTSAASRNIGRLQQVSAGSYIESFGYDGIGRLASQSITIPSDATYTYDYSYDATTGHLDTITYPTSTASYRLKLKHAYQNGMLQSISDFNAPSTVFWTANAMNARGQVTQETLGNGVVTNRAFDAVTGWISSQQSGVGGGAALQNESYLFDLVGNLTQRQSNNAGLTENFFYDSVYRLDYSQLGAVTNLDLVYDAMGNITSRTDVAGGATWTYHPTRKHAVTQAGSAAYTYTYDANGNALTRNGLTINWTSFNRPSLINGKSLYDGSSQSVQFEYNHHHTRWKAVLVDSSGTETTYMVGGLLEKVLSAGSTDYRHFIYAGGAKIAIYSRTAAGANTLRYVREDHLGSTAAILSNTGASLVKESFTAFGLKRSTCTWTGNPTSSNLALAKGVTRRGYTWHTALGAMGLNDMNGRVQDAVTGRFLSADPFISDPNSTQNYNRYSYVNNNPLTFNDPSGFAAQPPKQLLDSEYVQNEITVTARLRRERGFADDMSARNAIDRMSTGVSALKQLFILSDLRVAAPLPIATQKTDKESKEPDQTQGEQPCTFNSARAQAARSNPTDPSNLAAGTYASKTNGFSAGYYGGVGIENRYLADFTTRTVHQLSYAGGTLGYKFGASMQWSGGPGNVNYTTIGSGSLGWGGSGGASLILGGGGSVSYDGSSWTRSIGAGLDVGFSAAFGFTDYDTAWPIESLPESLSDLGDFYEQAYNRECVY